MSKVTTGADFVVKLDAIITNFMTGARAVVADTRVKSLAIIAEASKKTQKQASEISAQSLVSAAYDFENAKHFKTVGRTVGCEDDSFSEESIIEKIKHEPDKTLKIKCCKDHRMQVDAIAKYSQIRITRTVIDEHEESNLLWLRIGYHK